MTDTFNKSDNDFYIKILEYFAGQGLKGVNKTMFVENFGTGDDTQDALTWIDLTDKVLTPASRSQYANINFDRFILSLDGRFKLLEVMELREARESSETAKKDAKIAIFLTLVVSLISIIFSVWQVTSPVQVSAAQFSNLEKCLNTIEYNIELNTSATKELNSHLVEMLKQNRDIIEDIKKSNSLIIDETCEFDFPKPPE